jgi:paraquat-inducible protein B
MTGATSLRSSATRIGLFALGGLAVLIAAVVAVFGAGLFAHTEQAVLQFRGSVYGLQIGSPVVFRGVRLGHVRSVGVVLEAGRFSAPVVVDVDVKLIRTAANEPGVSLKALIEKGLTAQLATQSLLTGQLYIDLDLRASAAGQSAAAQRNAQGLIEIPTTLTRFQSLQDQLDQIDITRISADLTATVASAKALVGGPEIKQTLADMASASAALAKLSASLNERVAPLAAAAQGTLAQAGQASTRAGAAAERASERFSLAADGIASAATRAESTLAPNSQVMRSVQQAAEELSRSAKAVRDATSEDAALAQNLQRALGDVQRAARAVRELAEQLEQQPQSLLRGKPAPP